MVRRNQMPRFFRPANPAPGLSERPGPCQNTAMSSDAGNKRSKGALSLGELVGRAIAPITARRGFATADLVAAWPELAGPLHAGCTAPDKISWPRRNDEGDEPAAGVLFLKVDGPRAIYVQHDLPQILERVNAFFGYRAIGRIRIVQGPVADAASPAGLRDRTPVDPAAGQAIAETVASVEDDRLRAALERLGRGVHGIRRE